MGYLTQFRFVVYSADRQHIQYLVEFRFAHMSKELKKMRLPGFFIGASSFLESVITKKPAEVVATKQSVPNREQVCGLLAENGVLVPLVEVNVQAKVRLKTEFDNFCRFLI